MTCLDERGFLDGCSVSIFEIKDQIYRLFHQNISVSPKLTRVGVSNDKPCVVTRDKVINDKLDHHSPNPFDMREIGRKQT